MRLCAGWLGSHLHRAESWGAHGAVSHTHITLGTQYTQGTQRISSNLLTIFAPVTVHADSNPIQPFMLSPPGSGRGKVDTTICNRTAQLSPAQPRSAGDDINVATPG